MRSLPVLLLLILTSAGCYHTMVTTGAEPGTQVIDQPWAMSFVYGLIPPATVDAGAQCPAGVAIVETELSFLNQLVAALSGGLITPMHIKITCAAGGMALDTGAHEEITLSGEASHQQVIDAFRRAADRAVESGSEVYVRFE